MKPILKPILINLYLPHALDKYTSHCSNVNNYQNYTFLLHMSTVKITTVIRSLTVSQTTSSGDRTFASLDREPIFMSFRGTLEIAVVSSICQGLRLACKNLSFPRNSKKKIHSRRTLSRVTIMIEEEATFHIKKETSKKP